MSTTSTPATPRPLPAAELHGLPLVAHIEALIALASDQAPQKG